MIARVGRMCKGLTNASFDAELLPKQIEPITPSVAPEPTNPITVELQVHQRLSLRGRELARTRHPLSCALNEFLTAQSVIRWGGIRPQISSSGRYGVGILGVFGKRLRGGEQPGTRPQNGCARPSRERVIEMGKFGNRRRAVASRQSLKRLI